MDDGRDAQARGRGGGRMKLDQLRGTGRTTRMLAEAVAQAERGRQVIIVAANTRQAKEFGRQLTGCPVRGRILLTAPPMAGMDWHSMRPRFAAINDIVLIDHYAIESTWNQLVTELHAYDDKPTSEEEVTGR